MKKFILRSLLFMVFTIVFYVVMTVVFGALVPSYLNKNLQTFANFGFTRQRLSEAAKTKNVDILVIGSSHAYRGYDPRIFERAGLKIFNLGSSSQSLLQTDYLLNKYVNNLNPRLVIIETYPYLLNSDGIESAIDLISCGNTDNKMFEMAIKINNIKVYNNLLYGSINKLGNFTEQKSISMEGDVYVPGGYVQSYRTLGIKKRKSIDISISALQLDALKRIINTLKSKNIKYVMVQSPFSEANYNSYKNNDEIDAYLSKYGKYFNFNKIVTITPAMCYDDSHLNQLGVNVFNKALIDTLKKERFNTFDK